MPRHGLETSRFFPLRRVRQDVATLGVGGKPQHWKGHSPIGSWSAVALLLLIGLQATTGLMTQDDIVVVGPLVYYLPNSVVVFATQTHYLLAEVFYPTDCDSHLCGLLA